jgi:hypothetical protein
VRTTFVSCAHIHRAKFWFLHYYLLRAIFVSSVDFSCAFHSTCCTMPKFSMPSPHTTTLCAPLIKLSGDNRNAHHTHTNKIPLRSTNIDHITHAISTRVHTVHTLLCVCTLHASIMHASLNPNCTMLNLACAPAHQHFFAWRQK